ncbi:DUF3613 domain-containing protein [Variovorax paradoxus]|uniref:DUF3613 domain-containing protein n=1 Tax=Variovorax paradoxus TaxID=34073 RepID=UPI003D64F0BE
MKYALSRRSPTLPLLPAFGMVLMIAIAGTATSARANDTVVKTEVASDARQMAEMEAAEESALQPLRVGDATEGLLAWQRSGQIASPTPRPIPGVIAHRSYERYLKSFEHPIPEYLNSSVKKAPSGSGQ